MLPDFLETDHLNYKRTNNSFHRFHKFIHLNLSVMKYITIIFYASAKSTNFKIDKIDKAIFEKFSRPTEGSWLSLLELLLSSSLSTFESEAKSIKKKLSNKSANNLNIAFNLFMDSQLKETDSLNIFQYFQRVISIKNKLISHGIISEDKSIKMLELFEPLFDEVLDNLKNIFSIPIYLLEEDVQDHKFKIISICNSIPNENVFDGVNENGLYCLINNEVVYISPFFICRDGNVYTYNWYDRKNGKVHYSGSFDKDLYLRTSATDIAELFNLDKDGLFISPLIVDVKVSTTGVYHNLPSKDYSDFIGRVGELYKLESMLHHPRHFISALDGIGGVGKSAITLEMCYRITNMNSRDPSFFEHIVWLSAKNTIFKNGSIHRLEQSFEHLDQLLDTILDVLHFSEYKILEINKKKQLVNELLSTTNALIVLDNLETLKKGVLNEVWDFINEIPAPSKTLLTSREFHYDVPQTLRIASLSNEDSNQFIQTYSNEIGLDYAQVDSNSKNIIDICSGLPIAIKSILGQMVLGKSFKSIQKDIANNTDDLSKFCFQQQLSLLNEEHKHVLMVICLSQEVLDYDAITYMFPALSTNLLNYINLLSSLSIIKISHESDIDSYSILPLIQRYIRSTYNNEEKITEITQKLNEYYQLKEIDSYTLLPIEERNIERGSLIPRKLVDKAMKHSDAGEVEQAEQVFKKVIKDYENESYVWYMYGMYMGRYQSKLSDAINCLKKADEITPNYLYNKKIGDFHLQMKNYQAAIKNYNLALEKSSLEQNKNEMRYCIAKTEYALVKELRRNIKITRNYEKIEQRNQIYRNIISNLETYISKQPSIYDGKLISIYRILSEANFGLRQIPSSLLYIEKAIDLSELEDTHIQYKSFILSQIV
jgi:tetratricopeptide (TPR) repeat protein